MLDLGLYDKEYAPNDNEYTNEEYPNYDENTGRWFKANAVDVTEEEFELIVKACEKKDITVETGSNGVAGMLKSIAITTYILGLIAGLIVGFSSESVTPLIAIWGSAFISGTIFLGFGEIIRLLHEINNK